MLTINEPQEPGYYRVSWYGEDDFGKAVASGIYFYRIETSDFMAVKTIVKTR
jgi:hypothetical protein